MGQRDISRINWSVRTRRVATSGHALITRGALTKTTPTYILQSQSVTHARCDGERFSIGCSSDRSRCGQEDDLAAVQGAPLFKQGLSSLQQSDHTHPKPLRTRFTAFSPESLPPRLTAFSPSLSTGLKVEVDWCISCFCGSFEKSCLSELKRRAEDLGRADGRSRSLGVPQGYVTAETGHSGGSTLTMTLPPHELVEV